MFAACTIYKSIYLGLIHASEHFLKAYGCTVLLLLIFNKWDTRIVQHSEVVTNDMYRIIT